MNEIIENKKETELSDPECFDVLNEFLSQSWSDGYINTSANFEDTTQAVHRALEWFHELYHEKGTWLPKNIDLCDLDGPYECSECGYHTMLDATYLEQVELGNYCPNCRQYNTFIEEKDGILPKEE